MIKREVICDRCGEVITAPHPDRITVSKQHYEEYTDYFGRKHKKSTYKVACTIHLCAACTHEFNTFMGIKPVHTQFGEECTEFCNNAEEVLDGNAE